MWDINKDEKVVVLKKGATACPSCGYLIEHMDRLPNSVVCDECGSSWVMKELSSNASIVLLNEDEITTD